MKYGIYILLVSCITIGFFAFVAGAPYADMRLPLSPSFKEGKLLFVGDMMLGRAVETRMRSDGLDVPFSGVKDFFNTFDLVVGNLEGPILSDHVQTPYNSVRFSFLPEVADVLSRNGVDVVSLANNHTHDKLEPGFLETQAFLRDANVAYFGHPLKVTTEYVHTEQVGDTQVVFVGANVTYSTFDLAQTVTVVEDLEKKYPKAVIVFIPHWGEEYVLVHSKQQEDIAYAMIDAGADVVIGHHPHVVQDTEEYKGKMIFYSLGNFIFDQIAPETKKGLAVELVIQKDKLVYVLHPIAIDRAVPRVIEE